MLSIFEPKRPPPLPRRVLVGVPLPDEAWKPTKRGAKDLKAGKVTEETVPRQHNKTPADAWNYTSNQVSPVHALFLVSTHRVRRRS
jgi:phospholipid-translocating ATPase